MKAIKVRLVQAWLQLDHRERYLLLWGGVCLGLYLAYAGYASLIESVVANTQQLAEKKETLAWIKQAETQIKSQQTGSVMLDKSKGLTVLSQQLKGASFHAFAYQLQQLNDDELQLSFDRVPYQACLTWLASMSKKYNISIKEFHMDRTDTQGLVKWTVIITLNT
ncbi:MAG: type II secretion system protein GspM [Legionellaceae bacterium]|nr:type II secretion system protein GspM [Legionellaceae bacterium]